MAFDLSTLPAPKVVEELSFEAILAALKADLVARFPAIEPTLQLESAVITKALQTASYREILVRARVNKAALARFLAFAEDGDLDHLAAFYDVYRLLDERDERLRERVVLGIQGRSTGGPAERYMSVAMAADIRVKSVSVYRVGRSPIIYVAIFSAEPDGVASEALLDKVRAALTAKSVQLVNDTIVVVSAVRRVVDLAGDIWLLPDADDATVSRAITALRAAWETERALGRDITQSWWTSRLMISGVHKITPTTVGDQVAGPTEALSIGSVTLTPRGRDF